MKDYYPEFCDQIINKAELAYAYATEDVGNTQTACVVSPFFYEEDSFVDDIELAAATFMHFTGQDNWRQQADYWGELEPVSPWMELGRGRHYQFYPFINLGHYYLAKSDNEAVSKKYTEYMRQGLQDIKDRAADDPFMSGIPYIWCSNNLTTAMLTQCRLYRELTGDDTYAEMEASLRDWLFGCNPWGTSMVVELPKHGDYPVQPHSSYLNAGKGTTVGGLVDGPVYYNIFKHLEGVNMEGIPNTPGDTYDRFQPDLMVYHDVIGDYSTNEPTMDGTACLTYYLSAMQKDGIQPDKLFFGGDYSLEHSAATSQKGITQLKNYFSAYMDEKDMVFAQGNHDKDATEANGLTGWRNWVTNKPISKPEDLNGLKIRTMGNPLATNSVNAMGALATPMAQSECYNAIETKVIDGGEWQIPTIYSSKFYEVCKHISTSQHFLLPCEVTCGVMWYDTLSAEQQEQLKTSCVQNYKDNQAIVIEYEQKYLEEMKAAGVTVTEPDREAFKAATAHLYADPATTGGVDYESLRVELLKQLGA